MLNVRITIFLLLCIGGSLLYSCAKYKDSAPYNDPRLTNPYCNDPNAVNYNWGFPGKPDNTICFYPNSLFQGIYLFHDSVYSVSTGYFLFADSFTLTIHSISDSVISVFGFCGARDSLLLKAGANYIATIDTLVGDSATTEGQLLCNMADTIYGTMTKDRLDSPSVIHISFTVSADTGATNHIGSAIIQP